MFKLIINDNGLAIDADGSDKTVYIYAMDSCLAKRICIPSTAKRTGLESLYIENIIMELKQDMIKKIMDLKIEPEIEYEKENETY